MLPTVIAMQNPNIKAVIPAAYTSSGKTSNGRRVTP
jgi:hypothetical protein